jgi:hypothetical protein
MAKEKRSPGCPDLLAQQERAREKKPPCGPRIDHVVSAGDVQPRRSIADEG